jgi:hypothetical protein
MHLKGSRAWRFGMYDLVRCNLGGELGWQPGNVQAQDEACPEGLGMLPYVVMLERPLARLISAPRDVPTCIRPQACYEDGPAGGACAESVARQASTVRPPRPLRFAAGDRVACLTAGPDGAGWPRRWNAGTVLELWPTPAGAEAPAAVPYAIALDADGTERSVARVLAAKDDHRLVRKLSLQPVGPCEDGATLARFSVVDGMKTDQQTFRQRPAPSEADSDSDSDSDSEA